VPSFSQKTAQLVSAYQSLTTFEQILVQLLSVIYEPVNRTAILNCLQKADIKGVSGPRLTIATVSNGLHMLQRHGFLGEERLIDDCFVEVASRIAVTEGYYEKFARIVQQELPLSYFHGRKSHKCQRIMREYRIGVYTHDIPTLENLVTLLQSQCRSIQSVTYPAVQVCARPFQEEWFSTLPTSLQFYLLDRIFTYNLHYLDHLRGPFDYLNTIQEHDGIPLEERLPFHRILAGYLLWRGDLESVSELIEQCPESFVASGYEGCLHFLAGDNAKALESFDLDLQQLGAITGRKKVFFSNISGVFYVLALFKSGESEAIDRIGDCITMARAQQPGAILLVLYGYLEAIVMVRSGRILEAEALLEGLKKQDHSVARLFAGLTACWMEENISKAMQEEFFELYNRAVDGGFYWLALEYAEVLARSGWPSGDRICREEQNRTGLVSVISAVKLEESWQRKLQALIAVTARSLGRPKEVRQSSQLAWLVSCVDGEVRISPRERRLSAKGRWSKGRPVSLARLYEKKNVDFLTDQDFRIIGALRQESTQGQKAYYFDMEKALPALIGHPMLFLEDSPSVQIEFVKGDPELLVEESGEMLLLNFARDITGKDVSVIRETPTRFKVIEITDDHRQISRILGREGLHVPKSSKDQVMTAIANLSSYMTVHSSIAADRMARYSQAIEEVTADVGIYVHLLPIGAGFRLEMFVKPLGVGGPYLKPGKGAENVMAEVEGRRLQARRNLALEDANATAIEEKCPTLTTFEDKDREWHLMETVDCLQVLLELQELKDKVTVEWPEGQRLTISHHASFDQLYLRIRKRNQWFELDGRLELDESLILDMKTLIGLTKKTASRFIPLGDGQFLALTEELRKRLEDLDVFAAGWDDDQSGTIRVHPLVSPALDNFVDSIPRVDADDEWYSMKERLSRVMELDPSPPSTLHGELRDYQLEGYKWLYRLSCWGMGACLADDMGLGKTLQSLAIILERASKGPSLVIAPTSVCSNWQDEVTRFAPTLEVKLLNTEREKIVEELGSFDLLITSYTLMQQEIDLLAKVDWQTVVLDEAQAIKNVATKRSKAAKALEGRFKLVTTGTPIENHLGELWNLFDFITPGLLGPIEQFNYRFTVPIERDRDREARRKLKRLIQPFILRRLKSQVLEELPPKTEVVLQVEMGEEEAAFYEALRRRSLEKISGLQGEQGRNMQILTEIMKLRRACCNPRLIVPETTVSSSKMEVFAAVVDELLANRHKVLVFSQFVGHLAIIREYLEERGIEYRYLDGTTPARQRRKEVNGFQAGQGDIFLISLKAGGLGLNLTAADYVIHMDPWWNPAVEDQASDRAHRIGQKHPVTIYRLVTKNTIEEKIVQLHQDKRDLADSLLEGSDISARISAEELLSLIKEG
jgi:hypothetical protein